MLYSMEPAAVVEKNRVHEAETMASTLKAYTLSLETEAQDIASALGRASNADGVALSQRDTCMVELSASRRLSEDSVRRHNVSLGAPQRESSLCREITSDAAVRYVAAENIRRLAAENSELPRQMETLSSLRAGRTEERARAQSNEQRLRVVLGVLESDWSLRFRSWSTCGPLRRVPRRVSRGKAMSRELRAKIICGNRASLVG